MGVPLTPLLGVPSTRELGVPYVNGELTSNSKGIAIKTTYYHEIPIAHQIPISECCLPI